MADKDDLAQRIRHPGWQAAAVVAVIAIALTAALGGFRKARAKQSYPEIPAGQTVSSDALAITPLRAWVAWHRPGGVPDRYNPRQYLVLQLRAENRTDRSDPGSHLGNDVVWLPAPGQGGEGPQREVRSTAQYHADDHSIGVQLHPRMPTDVDVVWEFPSKAALPARLTWGLYERRFIEQTWLTRDSGWVQGDPKAKLVLAVEDRRNPAVRAP
ncbi:MAG TPA: hypothetical protein VGD42_13820 [Lysobacter sp.]